MSQITFYVYMLRCADDSFYVGLTDNIEKRLSEHDQGSYGGHTKSRRPLKLAYAEDYPTSVEAFARERQLKGWSRAKKEALLRRDWLSLVRLSESRVRLRGLIFDDWGNDLGRAAAGVVLRGPQEDLFRASVRFREPILKPRPCILGDRGPKSS